MRHSARVKNIQFIEAPIDISLLFELWAWKILLYSWNSRHVFHIRHVVICSLLFRQQGSHRIPAFIDYPLMPPL